MNLPARFGLFTFHAWDGERGREPVALTTMLFNPKKEVLLRIHSECLTGDAFYSKTCDCGPQKETALKRIAEHGNGIFIYQRQEGRNMGLLNKIRAYALIQEGKDTHEANTLLDGGPDNRDFSDVLSTLGELCEGAHPPIRLLSNNPYKKLVLERAGYSVTMEPLLINATPYNEYYMATKRLKFLHGETDSDPYVGVSLAREDLHTNGQALAELFARSRHTGVSRKLFVGIALKQQDLSDEGLVRELNAFWTMLAKTRNTYAILHINNPGTRIFYRSLRSFLGRLSFPYSVQFRLAPDAHRMDMEMVDSLQARQVIVQIKSEQDSLFQQQGFTEYFRSPNKFLLLDESFGRGVHAEYAETKSRVATVIAHGIGRIGVAGGFGPTNLAEVTALEDHFKIPISVDAESRLRTSGKLDMRKVEACLDYFFSF